MRYKNLENINLVHAQKPKVRLFFAIARSKLFSFIFFLAVPKSWVFIKDKAWKWDLDQL